MKAKLLAIIVVAIAIVPFGLPSSGQDRPSRSAMILACEEANWLISELIEHAPNGTGWVNRTKAWINTWAGIIGDILSMIFDTQLWRGWFPEIDRAVIIVDLSHTSLHYDLSTIMNADLEVVEGFLPGKWVTPQDYIHGLKFLKTRIVDRECKRFLGVG